MALPAAVLAKATRAHELQAEAIARRAGAPAAAARPATPAKPAAPQPAAADVPTLQRQLADAQELLRKANLAHDTLRGKYDAEVPRLSGQARQLNTDLTKATARNTELEGLLAAKFDAGTFNSLTAEDRQLAGDGLVTVIGKIAREAATHVVTTSIKPLSDRVGEFERMDEDRYFLTLDELAPDWLAQNEDPRFMAWLQQFDPTTQRPRLDALKRAEGAKQGNRVAEIFRAFREGREIGALTPAAPDVNAALRVGEDPPAGGGSVIDFPVDEHGKRIWTGAAIKQFYADKVRGKYRGKEAEARLIEEDIFAARSDGRLTG